MDKISIYIFIVEYFLAIFYKKLFIIDVLKSIKKVVKYYSIILLFFIKVKFISSNLFFKNKFVLKSYL